MDWNEDNKKDLLVGDTDGFIHLFINTGTDEIPELAAGKKLQVGGKDFKYEERAKPEVTDWNNDGKKDLLVGMEMGKVLLLLNIGTNDAPRFEKAVPLKDGEQDLQGVMRVHPAVWDWNGDSKKDLLCADEAGDVTCFQNTGTDDSPRFSGGVKLQARGWPISPGSKSFLYIDWDGDGQQDNLYVDHLGHIQLLIERTIGKKEQTLMVGGKPFECGEDQVRLEVTDWNNDSRLDLLCGMADGKVLLLLNIGTAEKPDFDEATPLMDGAKELDVGSYVSPEVKDWNEDGKKDLICFNGEGSVLLYLNQGHDEAPRFAGGMMAKKDRSPICGGYRSSIEVVDWNNDGKADLLYGVVSYNTRKGNLYIFLASPYGE